MKQFPAGNNNECKFHCQRNFAGIEKGKKFREKFPDGKLSLLEMTPAEQWAALIEGRIEIGFTRTLEPEFRSELGSIVLRHDSMMSRISFANRQNF